MYRKSVFVCLLFLSLIFDAGSEGVSDKKNATSVDLSTENSTSVGLSTDNSTSVGLSTDNSTSVDLSIEKATADKSHAGTYTAAVVHYNPFVYEGNVTKDAIAVALKNANNIKSIIEDAKTLGIDIIVFPEFGITSRRDPRNLFKANIIIEKEQVRNKIVKGAKQERHYYHNISSRIPSLKEPTAPCNYKGDDKIAETVRIVSCAANDANMYVVINHYEEEKCQVSDACPDGFRLYNANVVFNRQGAIVARHRKFSTQYEPWLDKTHEPSKESIFTTDFGVNFTLIGGMDILNKNLTNWIVRNNSITDIILTAHYFEDLPIFFTPQDHMSWAEGKNINVLVSSARNGASDIYFGHTGQSCSYFEALHNRQNYILYAKVPIARRNQCIQHKEECVVVHFDKKSDTKDKLESNEFKGTFGDRSIFTYFSPTFVESELLDTSIERFSKELCIRNYCCYFEIEMSYNKSAFKDSDIYYSYRAIVAKSVLEFSDSSTAKVDICAVIACPNDQVHQCGIANPDVEKYKSLVTFNSIVITRLVVPKNSFYAPLASNFKSLMKSDSDYGFITTGAPKVKLLILSSNNSLSDFSSFGINVRRFIINAKKEIEHETYWYWIFIIFITLLVVIGIGVCLMICLSASWGMKLRLLNETDSIDDCKIVGQEILDGSEERHE